MISYQHALQTHYHKNWDTKPVAKKLDAGPMKRLSPDFCILKFAPFSGRDMWTYATNGMSLLHDKRTIELHIFSFIEDDSLVELLTIVAHYHATGSELRLGDTVNFGKPWQEDSKCTYGLISLPYLDGPELESFPAYSTECYWLIPITVEERDYKIKFGLESLEEKFDSIGLDYINPNRASVI